MEPTVRSKRPETAYPNDLQLIHGEFLPGDVRQGEAIEAYVQDHTGATILQRVWRLSPMGVELVKSADFEPRNGDRMHLELKLGDSKLAFHGVVVAEERIELGRALVGVRWVDAEAKQDIPDERRSTERFLCSPNFYPTGHAPSPIKAQDVVFFRVRDISSTGAQIVTSMRNRHLLPGMVLHARLALPTVGETGVAMELTHVRAVNEGNGSYVHIGARFDALSQEARRRIGQYLLQFGSSRDVPPSVTSLRAAGLEVESAAKAVEFGFVRTAAEYDEVLELRRMAYMLANKVATDTKAADMGDVFDDRARILIARYRGKIVASVRLIYHSAADRWEHEEYVTFPASFPPKDEIVEITRVCTHPDYRGEDLLLALFRQVLVTAVESNKRYILGCATTKLLPLYERLGCKRTALKFNFAALGGIEHTIFLADIERAFSGGGISPLAWNLLFVGTKRMMHAHFDERINAFQRTRMAVFRSMGFAMPLVLRRAAKPRKQR